MNSSETQSDQELTLAELTGYLRRLSEVIWCGRRQLLRTLGIGFGAGLIISFGSGEEFTASTRILPYRSGSGTAASLSGLAGLAGVRLPSGAGEQTITADLYPEVVKSLDFRIEVAESPLTFSDKKQKATSVEYFRDLYEEPLLGLVADYTFGLPGKIAERLKPQPKRLVDAGPADSTSMLLVYDQAYLEIIKKLTGRLKVALDKKTSIITIVGTMPDPYAAASLVDVASDKLMKRIIKHESQKAAEQYRFINEQNELARNRLEIAQRNLAAFADRNRSLGSATAQLEQDRLQRETDRAFELFQQFSRELDQSRIKMSQDTPVFTVLERVIVPSQRSKPKRTRAMLLSLALAAIVGITNIVLRGRTLKSA